LTICLSKGLGAPIGSLLCGSKEYIKQANRWRKMTGGGMRQSGILAAAGLYALENNVQRLQDDHDNALWLEQQLRDIGVEIAAPGAQTNILYIRQDAALAEKMKPWMLERGVIISTGATTRLVTHINISRADLQKVVSLWKEFLQLHA